MQPPGMPPGPFGPARPGGPPLAGILEATPSSPTGGMPLEEGGGGLQMESGFKAGPTAAIMYTYVPKSFKKGSPVVVALHHCAGTAPGYFREYPDWPKSADQKGFMMVSLCFI